MIHTCEECFEIPENEDLCQALLILFNDYKISNLTDDQKNENLDLKNGVTFPTSFNASVGVKSMIDLIHEVFNVTDREALDIILNVGVESIELFAMQRMNDFYEKYHEIYSNLNRN